MSNRSDLELAELLRRSGYERGEFLTLLMAERLKSVCEAVARQGVDPTRQVLKSGTRDEIRDALRGARGVGPTVIRNFLMLRA
jgi:3-methyladenine DNA glycosylase/8-oxoguanine DNA glycosylase